jgi:hypothetical protein
VIRLPVISAAPDAIPVHHNCGRCSAICCHYVSTEIDLPTSKRDFDIIRWYLMHPGVRVYCEDITGSWFVQYESRCENLRADHLCGIYETRPQICRDLDPEYCEFAMGAGDRYMFTNIGEFEIWFRERERKRNERRRLRPGRARANGTSATVRRATTARRATTVTTRKRTPATKRRTARKHSTVSKHPTTRKHPTARKRRTATAAASR